MSQLKNAVVAVCAVGLLAGRRCLNLAGVVFEPDTGANSATAAAPAAQGGTAVASPPAGVQTQAAPAAPDQSGMMVALGQAIGSAISQAVAPIQQTQQAMGQQLQALTGPARNVQSALFGGGAPAVVVGELHGSRGYEFGRAMALKQGALKPETAKVELAVHEKLREYFVKQKAMDLEDPNSLLVPLGAAYLPDELDSGFRGEIGQMTRQSVQNVDPAQIPWLMRQSGLSGGVRQALSQYDDTGFGNFIGPAGIGELIDLLRNKEVFSRAGATDFALPANGRLKFNRLTGAMTAYWVGEAASNVSAAQLTASTPTSGELLMSAKKLAVLVKSPNELLRFGGPTIEAMFRDDMTKVMALQADSTMLTGSGSTNSPKGLLNYSINSWTASTVATDGNTLEPQDLGNMIAMVEDDNIDVEADGFAWMLRAVLHWQIYNKRVTPYSGGTNLGEFVFSTNRAAIDNGKPMQLMGYPTVRSNQIPNTRTKGASTDLTCLIGGCFKNWLIGRVGVIEFATQSTSDVAFQADQTHMRAIQHLDAAPRYEEAFVYCDKLDVTP